MNKKTLMTVMLIAMSVAVVMMVGAIFANAECPYKKAEKHDCPMKMEGVSVNITNIDKGVKIEMTADKPELVKKLQNQMKAEGKDEGCAHKKAESKDAGCAQHKEGIKHEGCMCKCPCAVEGASKKITNTDNGVTVEITAEKEDAVKEIQARAAKMNEPPQKEAK